MIDFVLLVIGIAAGYAACLLYYRYKKQSFRDIAQHIVREAELQAEKVIQQATSHANARSLAAQLSSQEQLHRYEKQKIQIEHLQQQLEKERSQLQAKLSDLAKKERDLATKSVELDARLEEAAENLRKSHHLLEQQAHLSQQEAEKHVMEEARRSVENECQKLRFRKLQEVEASVEEEARKLIVGALARCPEKYAGEWGATTYELPSDELKAKIIGREGKNLRVFEQMTGVKLVIDDTPSLITLSSFDPLKRHVAQQALSELIRGPIHPTRIEEVVATHRAHIDDSLVQLGQQAARRAHVASLHPELHRLLGKLSFRPSYGQNTLEHSIEVSYLMALIASELRLDVLRARRIGLLHDIGKAATAEISLAHAITGYELALQYDEPEEVANGIGCHHDQMAPKTLEAALCRPADALSAALPGKRSEQADRHFQRIESMERIATAFPGVQHAFAVDAGRELRVFVRSDEVDDGRTAMLAKEIAAAIARALDTTYRTRVAVIREKKAIEYVHWANSS